MSFGRLTREMYYTSESNALSKSVKRLNLEGKMSPKKFRSDKSTDKQDSGFNILASRKKVDKEKIQTEIIKSKLLEPLIDSSIRKKENVCKSKLKNEQKEKFQENNPFNQPKSLNVKANGKFALDEDVPVKKLKEGKNSKSKLFVPVFDPSLVEADQNDGKISKSQMRLLKEKKFCFNEHEDGSQKLTDAADISTCSNKDSNLNNIISSKIIIPIETKHVNKNLETNEIINNIIGNKEPVITDYFAKSKCRANLKGTKTKNAQSNKRKPEDLSASDAEKTKPAKKNKNAYR